MNSGKFHKVIAASMAFTWRLVLVTVLLTACSSEATPPSSPPAAATAPQPTPTDVAAIEKPTATRRVQQPHLDDKIELTADYIKPLSRI
ncbi:MAG TPA: hypothetical protein P5526_31590 [Anaerolineae bacterium]|nr:hypothetical protein [Anaerolineae bacterium]